MSLIHCLSYNRRIGVNGELCGGVIDEITYKILGLLLECVTIHEMDLIYLGLFRYIYQTYYYGPMALRCVWGRKFT